MSSEAARLADFSGIRYAQCWEDADVLLDALDVQPGDVCFSIASAGDNALALLTRAPSRVVAIDLSPAQLACLELRVAGYRELEHPEFLEFLGSSPSTRRLELYARCRRTLSPSARSFWDARSHTLATGFGSLGKFERYLSWFRRLVLPLVHPKRRVERLLRGGTRDAREAFYVREWDTWRWRLLFRLFFSRFVMGRLGRDPAFFRYVEGSVAERILARTRHALTAIDPALNPYVQWILTGRHTTALPCALRPEHFGSIRTHLDRLEWQCISIEDWLDSAAEGSFDAFNLSDVFEYMSEDNCARVLAQLARVGRPGSRLVYWNMLAPRRRPDALADRLRALGDLARRLHNDDKAFFYSALVVEEVT